MAKTEGHAWEFKARFRSRAFRWKSQPAITRIKQAVAEIKKVAKKEPVAAEGAVAFLERVSPAVEQVDGSSGSMGAAVVADVSNPKDAGLKKAIARVKRATKRRNA